MWFRLPDGDVNGGGFSVTGYQSLRELYFGTISSITTQPGTSVFTLASLKSALTQIITLRAPTQIRTLDYLSGYDGGDHSDHYSVGRIVASIAGTAAPGASLSGYMGYPIQNLNPNIDTASQAYINKTNEFFAYTYVPRSDQVKILLTFDRPYDVDECQSLSACAGRGEAAWLQRQYIVTPALATTSATAGGASTAAVLPAGTNIARQSVTSASSAGSTQPSGAAIDGVISGYVSQFP